MNWKTWVFQNHKLQSVKYYNIYWKQTIKHAKLYHSHHHECFQFYFNYKITFHRGKTAHCDSSELHTVHGILKRINLWVLPSARTEIGSTIMTYFWGEHGQESNRSTLDALHPDQGIAVVLPSEFNIKNSNKEKVDPHEAVCTWTKIEELHEP